MKDISQPKTLDISPSTQRTLYTTKRNGQQTNTRRERQYEETRLETAELEGRDKGEAPANDEAIEGPQRVLGIWLPCLVSGREGPATPATQHRVRSR